MKSPSLSVKWEGEKTSRPETNQVIIGIRSICLNPCINDSKLIINILHLQHKITYLQEHGQ